MKLTYDAISPFTNEKTVLIEHDELNNESGICMETGYAYIANHTDNPDLLADFLEKMPDYIKSTKFVDEYGKVWFKTMAMSFKSLIRPNGDSWEVFRFKPVMGEDVQDTTLELSYVTNTGVLYIVDQSSLNTFDNFTDAFNAFNYNHNIDEYNIRN